MNERLEEDIERVGTALDVLAQIPAQARLFPVEVSIVAEAAGVSTGAALAALVEMRKSGRVEFSAASRVGLLPRVAPRGRSSDAWATSGRHAQVLAVLATEPGASLRRVSYLSGQSTTAAYQSVQDLTRLGMVAPRMVGRSRRGWMLTERGKLSNAASGGPDIVEGRPPVPHPQPVPAPRQSVTEAVLDVVRRLGPVPAERVRIESKRGALPVRSALFDLSSSGRIERRRDGWVVVDAPGVIPPGMPQSPAP
jgi:hypothetical protein